MIGLSQDRFIVHCDHNNRGEGVAKHKSKSQTDQNEYNFGHCCCTDKQTNTDDCNCYVFGLLSLCTMVYWLFGCIPLFIDFL